MVRQKTGAIIRLGGAPISTPAQQEKIVALSARSRLPTLYPGRWIVNQGGLLSYGPNLEYRWATAAGYVDKILKGANPADLPIDGT
jgi:putative ABC transport system substrate-binding protein